MPLDQARRAERRRRPALQRSSSFFTRANAMIGPPDAFWHMRQWQTLTWWGAANSS